MAANDGNHPIRELFGVTLPDGTGAPGSQGAHGTASDDQPAGLVSVQGTGVWQPDGRYDASTGGTVMPDQAGTSDISPGPQDQYTSTGAGHGSGSHYPRRAGQQEA